MALHRLGFGFGQHVELETLQPVKQQWGGHAATQTAAAVVGALATVMAAVKGSTTLAWGLAAFMLLTMILVGGNRALTFFRVRRFQARRDKMARAQHLELLGSVKQFARFVNSGDYSNLRNIIFNACGNSPEKCAQLCPPDYMHDLCPFLVQDFDTRSENEREFLLAIQKFYGYIASYNKEYVIEPMRRMRMKQWPPASASGLVPEHVTWIESLPPNYRENAERQIEDFRERWAGFLDNTKQWIEKVGELFGTQLPSWFERPQKL